MSKKSVVIVGAGFAGLNAAKILGQDESLSLTVIDKRNYHLFQPLLYQIAMAGLSPAEIASPIRNILAAQKNTKVVLGEVNKINREENYVSGDFGTIAFDYLLVATGAQHSYFGNNHWEEFAPGLKTVEQATEIRRRVLTAFELAENETNREKQRALLTFVVIGGGPTGVELAGALGEISRFTLGNDFKNIDPSTARVILVEAGDRLLASFDPRSSAIAKHDLENLGVNIWTKTRVSNISAEGIELGSEKIAASTVIWAAGVQPSALNANLNTALDKSGRIIVREDLSIPGSPHIFSVGDQVHFEQDGRVLPGQAPVAIQQGIHAAKNILSLTHEKPTRPFHFRDKGQMATIGRSRAVVEISGKVLSGFFAWMTWLIVHIYYLVGFKNRVFVIAQWIWAYLTYRRSARLILEKSWKRDS